MESELLAMSDDITRHPEIGFKETYAVQHLTEYLRRHNFEISPGTGGFETAFVARFKANRGKPVMGIILEYDALRGTSRPFHGDQHSAQGPIGIAVGVAMSEWLSETGQSGSIVLYGTPAEEIPSPSVRKILFERGVFNEADVIVRSHSSPTTDRPAPGFGSAVLNGDAVKYTFSGAPAHQAVGWDGRNALEAVIHLFVNVDSMRSSIRPEASIQGIILEGGAAPNVVPDRTVADFAIRYPDAVYLAQVRQIVDDAARAAALSTQTKLKIETYAEIQRRHLRGFFGRARLRLYEEVWRRPYHQRSREAAGVRRHGWPVTHDSRIEFRGSQLSSRQSHDGDGGRCFDGCRPYGVPRGRAGYDRTAL